MLAAWDASSDRFFPATPACQGVHVDFFPITIGFGFDGKPIPYCGAIDAETAAVDRMLVLDCPFTASDFPTGTPTYCECLAIQQGRQGLWAGKMF